MSKTWTEDEEKRSQDHCKYNRRVQKPQLPETWERYEIAQLYRLQGKSSDFLIKLYQKATWSIRDEAVESRGLTVPSLPIRF